MTTICSPVPPVVPPAVAGIDVNFCKNPNCRNFGIPAELIRYRRKVGTPLAATAGTAYGLFAVGKRRPALRCMLCGEIFSVKSNRAVAEEAGRFADYLLPVDAPACRTPGCANAAVPLGTAGAYYRFGATAAGTPRWRCRSCGTTTSVGGRALKRQRITHLNKTVLLALTSKMPIRRICKFTGLAPASLYGKIAFLHRQCLAFAAAHEETLRELMLARLYISVDRQDYAVNWDRAGDRRNIVLRAVGSADNDSGYVFGMHLAYDPSLDPVEVERDATAAGDYATPYPHRKYARLWLANDYEEALAEAAAERKRKATARGRGTLGDHIADTYAETELREDTEVSDLKGEEQRLPERAGMQIHEEYSLYGHFYFLRGLLRHVAKLRFFLDQDSGIRAACFAAFAKDILFRRVDAFYVRAAKEMTVDRKRGLITRSRAAFKAFHDKHPGLSVPEVEVELMKLEIAGAVKLGKWSDRWCAHPLPSMLEPAKAACWLTDLGDYDADHAARLYLRASLSGIDNFFQRVRRSLNPLERPLVTASSARRTWYGYSPYNPLLVEQLLTIYRVMHNYVEAGKDGKTPAMRLGIAKAPVPPEDLIYFESRRQSEPPRRKRHTEVGVAPISTR